MIFITNDLLDNNFYNICKSNKKAINKHVNVKANNFVITTDKDTCYINLRIGRLNSVTGESYTTKIFVYEPYTEQSVTFPYTLNAIPVESGGNVTIDGQEYISDYVDIEKKKLVKNVGIADLGTITPELVTASGSKIFRYSSLAKKLPPNFSAKSNVIAESCKSVGNVGNWLSIIEKGDNVIGTVSAGNEYGFIIRDSSFTDVNSFKQAMTGSMICYELATPTITYLTDEEAQAFKELATYYPTTNVFVTSEQLNGYAECKYPTTDVSGIASKNESRIAELAKDTDDKFDDVNESLVRVDKNTIANLCNGKNGNNIIIGQIKANTIYTLFFEQDSETGFNLKLNI